MFVKVLIGIGNKIAKLIDVKSIITIVLTIEFVILAHQGSILTEYLSIYTMIIGFYFGTQKKKEEKTELVEEKRIE